MTNEVEEIRNINLELESLKARKDAIKKQLSEHRDSFTDAQISETTKEAQEIRNQINATELKLKEAQERAKTVKQGENIKMENRENVNEKVNIRTAFAKHILFESTHRADAKLTDAEKRALGVASTTTSETFVEATADVDGINNGGVFIPQEVMLDILREEELESPIYRDIVTTAIKGKVKFPYRISKTGAKTKAELSPTENENVEWGILNAATGNYTDSIVITFEEEAMAIAEFTDYLISLIGESMRELLINDYIYGTGTNDHVFGITNKAITSTYAASDDVTTVIETAIAKLPVKKRAGAKVYLAANLFDKMTFAKDKNGAYLLPVLNGGGLTKFSSFTAEMDANLKEGDFIIGNVSKNYKANINKQMEIGLDVSNRNRIKTYTTHMMVTAAPVPNSFVYGKVQG